MPSGKFLGPLERAGDCCWRIPKSYKPGMRVDGLIYADDLLIEQIRADQACEQVANVATLPGIQMASLAMPDIHWGYGFCIGGVCATDPEQGGVISPGGVGYDINCGVRMVRTNLQFDEVRPQLERLVGELFANIPTGVGRGGKYKFSRTELRQLMGDGPAGLIKRDLAVDRDIDFTEAHGCLDGAEPDDVSERALDRGADQCGTLGSGNHFLEVQVVDRVFDQAAAEAMGVAAGSICVMIHSGSRGLGYQVCDDALKEFAARRKNMASICPTGSWRAPVNSAEGRKYLGAMRAAANFAWCNRQLLMWQAREVFSQVFGRSWEELGMDLVYDVAHNIAKFEQHEVDGIRKPVWVHRKGATRAFPPGHPEIPAPYQNVGQPVLIPGDMGRASWILAGQAGSMEQTFGTACHGAGRMMSRTAAVKAAQGRRIDQELRRARRDRQGPQLERAGRGTARCLQGCRFGGRSRPPRGFGQKGRTFAANRCD